MKLTRTIVIGFWVCVLGILGILIWILSRPQAVLLGECGRVDSTTGTCILQYQDTDRILRDCALTNCAQSEYWLGKRESGTQYIIFQSDSFAQMISVSSLKGDVYEEAVESSFRVPTTDNCTVKDNTYEVNCFTLDISEIQRKDIYEQNQRYQHILDTYTK